MPEQIAGFYARQQPRGARAFAQPLEWAFHQSADARTLRYLRRALLVTVALCLLALGAWLVAFGGSMLDGLGATALAAFILTLGAGCIRVLRIMERARRRDYLARRGGHAASLASG